MANEQPKSGAVLSLSQAAALVGKSERWVQLLAKEGFFAAEGRGKYPLLGYVRGVVAHYEARLDKSNKAATSNRATEARTREIELRTAERSRRLVAIEDHQAVVAEIAAMVNAELAGLPARITRDLELRAKIETETGRVLDRLRHRAQERSEQLRSGGGDLDSWGAEDARAVGGGE